MKIVSAEKGPFTLIPSFLIFFKEGIIIFFSSDFLSNSALCGFNPKKLQI